MHITNSLMSFNHDPEIDLNDVTLESICETLNKDCDALIKNSLVVSNEGLVSVLSGAISKVFVVFGNFLNKIIPDIFKTNNHIEALYKSVNTVSKKFFKIKDKISYLDVKNKMIATIPGLQVRAPSVSSELVTSLKLVNDEFIPALKNVDTLLTSMLKNMKVSSKSYDIADETDAIITSDEALLNTLYALVDPNSKSDLAPFSTIYGNIDEVGITVNNIKSYPNVVNAKTTKLIKTLSDGINDKLKLLITGISKSDGVDIDKTTINRTANLIKALSNYMTTVSSTLHYYSLLLGIVNNHLEFLIKRAK